MKAKLCLYLIILIICSLAINDQKVSASKTYDFHFHYFSEIYRNENSSIYIFDGADLHLPSEFAHQAIVECNIRQKYSGVAFWVGGVSWLTRPFKLPTHIAGSVAFKIWMSSSDTDFGSWGSGYGAGLVDVDENDKTVWNTDPEYKITYFGKAISNTPQIYEIIINNIDHTFEVGHKLGFAIGIGAAKKGWKVSVYFGEKTKDSKTSLSCNQIALDSPSSISCTLSNTTVFEDEVITFSGSIVPIHVAKVALVLINAHGKEFNQTATSDATGKYTYSFYPQDFGLWHVKTYWFGDTDHNNASSQILSFIVLAKNEMIENQSAKKLIPSSIACTLSSTTLAPSSSVIISGVFSPMSSRLVTIQRRTADDSIWDNITTIRSLQNGRYSYILGPANMGNYCLRAVLVSDGEFSSSTSNEVRLTIVSEPAAEGVLQDVSNWIIHMHSPLVELFWLFTPPATMICLVFTGGIVYTFRKRREYARHPCPSCGKALSYIKKYRRWYCYGCRKYFE